VEQALVDHVIRGEWLDLIPKVPEGRVIDEDAMRAWGESRTCPASVIRDILRGVLASKPDPHGLRLRGARISGRLDLENLTTDVNLELQDCLIDEGLTARGAHLASVALIGCQIGHPVEPPLDAYRLTCSTLILSRARIIGHAYSGAVRLTGAHILGNLGCGEACLRNDSGPALHGGGLQVDHGVFLHRRFTATGTGELGAVRLTGAHIAGGLQCDSGSFANDSGPALHGDGLQVGGSMLLRGFTATGAGELGAVRLTGAHIADDLGCGGACLRNGSGPALSGDRLQVGQAMFLCSGFTATGAGDFGAVRLAGAHIGGQLDCTKANLCNHSGPALLANGLQVGQAMLLHNEFTATGGGDGVAVDLTAVRLGGALLVDPERLKHVTCPHRRLAADGLTYAGVPKKVSATVWLDLLRDGTPDYTAQPYQQLAAGYRALGDDRQARKILMMQRDDQLARTDPPWPERSWGRITKITLGYGYQPWKALLFLATVVAISCVLAVWLGSHGALVQTSKTATPGRSCTVVQQVSVGLDLNLPVGNSVARADCDLTTDSASLTAAWLAGAGWVLRLLAWVFAALFIAGFTSAIRKT